MEIVIPLLIVLIPIAYQLWQYLDQKKHELRDKRFEVFHRLIRDLVEPPEGKSEIKLDRQIAIVFELRNFPEYRDVAERILKGLREHWSKDIDNFAPYNRLITEVDLTLGYITKHIKSKNT